MVSILDKFKKINKKKEIEGKIDSQKEIKDNTKNNKEEKQSSKPVSKNNKKDIAKKKGDQKKKEDKVTIQKAKPSEKIKSKYKNTYQILMRPLITEKVTDLGSQNKYAFEISLKSNKIEVRKAIRAMYGVEPIAVNIIKMKGKAVRFGKNTGKRKDWKKAIITLKQGEKIEVYSGV